MTKARIEKILAWFSIILVVPYFTLETYHYVEYGSYLPMLLVDYILMALFVLAGVVSLSGRFGSGAGLLCGAWGFAFCLNWRTLFWRLEAIANARTDGISEPIEQVATILIATFVLSVIAFLTSLWLAFPERVDAKA